MRKNQKKKNRSLYTHLNFISCLPNIGCLRKGTSMKKTRKSVREKSEISGMLCRYWIVVLFKKFSIDIISHYNTIWWRFNVKEWHHRRIRLDITHCNVFTWTAARAVQKWRVPALLMFEDYFNKLCLSSRTTRRRCIDWDLENT